MFCVGLALLGASAAPKAEITAALPVIPDAKFNLADYGGVGDYKTFNTDAFKNAAPSSPGPSWFPSAASSGCTSMA